MSIRLLCVVKQAEDVATVLRVDNFVLPISDSRTLAGWLRMCGIDPIDRKMPGEKNAIGVAEGYVLENVVPRYRQVHDVMLSK